MNASIKEQLEAINQQVKELAALYHGAASRAGVSDNEFWVWYALLTQEGEYSQQDICDMWSLPKQTVNSVVANLSRKGFVVLEAVPGTRNRKRIRLTGEGRRHGEGVVMPVYLAEQNALAQSSEEERRMYAALMGKYICFLREALALS